MNRTRLFILSFIIFAASVMVLFPIKEMFFLRDDFTILYKIQQHETLLRPYEKIITFYTPLYQWFGLNPQGYFLLAILLYGLSSLGVFVFFLQLAPVPVASLAALLYGSGLVALENMIQIMYADAIPILVILMTLALSCFIRYGKTGKILYLGVSLLLYYLAHDWFAHRAHLAYLSVLAVDLFFLPHTSVLKRALRQLPFFVIALLTYGSVQGAGAATQLIQIFLQYGKNIPINFANLILTPISTLVPKLETITEPVKMTIGILLAIGSLMLIAKSRKTKRQLATLHLFSLILVGAGFMAYLIFNPSFIISGISRYNTYTQFWIPLYIVSGLMLIRTRFLILILSFYILTSYAATYTYITAFNRDRSIPTKKFYQDLKTYLPTLPTDALLYIDQTNTLPYDPTEFMRVGRLPTEAAFATMYEVPRENLRYTDTFRDMVEFFGQHPDKLQTIYSFYIGQDGLVNTTDQVRSWLVNPKQTVDLSQIWKLDQPVKTVITGCPTGESIGIPPVTMSPALTIPSIAPITVRLTLRITPHEMSRFSYPYFQQGTGFEQIEEEYTCDTIAAGNGVSVNLLSKTIAFEEAKRIHLAPHAIASSSLPHDPPANAVDKDNRTPWTPDITAWSKERRAELQLDLRQEQLISRILLTPAHSLRLPTNFTVSTRRTSSDSWQDVAVITDGQTQEQTAYEITFPAINTRHIRLTITQTNTRLAPQIAELEAVGNQWSDVSLTDITSYRINPFALVPDAAAAQSLFNSWQNALPLRLYWKKDKDWDFAPENYVAFPAIADGTPHTYDVTIPAGGLTIEKLRLTGFIIPSTVSLGQ